VNAGQRGEVDGDAGEQRAHDAGIGHIDRELAHRRGDGYLSS
jgi:hypothetical protein